MSTRSRRETIFFEPKLHRELRRRADATDRSISRLVNEAVSALFSKEKEGSGSQANEPTLAYESIAETALLSEDVLAEDWNRPEEDEAWQHLQ